ncbi:hypothetical protein G6L37_07365 [Agrobacterium rubi]|nr:hypothetical protein [Agrobacterium rubi]NTF25186.1 hypothetical protein [Agrobacterium rubi]
MTSAAQTIASKPADMWDRLDNGAYWLPLAPTSADEYFSGETDNLFITREGTKWWLAHSGEAGQTPYASLVDAKTAGNTIIEASYADMDASIIASLGISTDDWAVVVDNGTIALTSVADSSIEIFGNDGTWSMDGDIIVRTRDFSKALEVATHQIAIIPTF